MKPDNSQLWIQGGLYTLIGALTPIVTTLSSDATLTTRATVAMILGAVVAGATALKAFLSTTFSESGAGVVKPVEAKIINDKTDPVPTEPQQPL